MVEFDRDGRMWDAHDIRKQGAYSLLIPTLAMVVGGAAWAIATTTWNGVGLAVFGVAFTIAAMWNIRRVRRDTKPKTKDFWYEPPQSGG